MKGLMIKDLCLLRNQGKSMLLMLALGLFMEVQMGAGTIIWFLTFLGAMLASGTANYDEFDNGFSFLFTLPITRRQYVREKYVFSVLFVLFCLAVSILFSLVFSLLPGRSIAGPSDILFMSSMGILISGFLLATVLPLRLKFGSEQSRIVWILFFLVITALIVGGGELFRRANSLEAFQNLSAAFKALNSWSAGQILAMCTVVSLVLLLISEQISERIVMKKEY